MRLTSEQLQMIRAAVQATAGQQASMWLFGSRLDEAKRGGDVDLLVQSTPKIGLLQRAKIKTKLERQLGLPVDVLCADDGLTQPAFVRIALAKAVRL